MALAQFFIGETDDVAAALNANFSRLHRDQFAGRRGGVDGLMAEPV